MISPEQLDRLTPRIRTIQIVTVAIIFGALVFAIVVAAIVDWDEVNQAIRIMTLFGAATAISMYVLAFIVPGLMSGPLASKHPGQPSVDSEESLVNAVNQFNATHIVHCAMIEGAIFLNLMTFMMERSIISLVVAGLGFGILLASFPFESKVIQRVSDAVDANRQDRL